MVFHIQSVQLSFHGSIEYRTSNLPPNVNNSRYRYPITPDATGLRPLATFVVNSSLHNCRKICHRGEGHDGVLVAFNDDGTAILKVKDGV
jgi:hypothetical protein